MFLLKTSVCFSVTGQYHQMVHKLETSSVSYVFFSAALLNTDAVFFIRRYIYAEVFMCGISIFK
jgi:hypothetical protein